MTAAVIDMDSQETLAVEVANEQARFVLVHATTSDLNMGLARTLVGASPSLKELWVWLDYCVEVGCFSKQDIVVAQALVDRYLGQLRTALHLGVDIPADVRAVMSPDLALAALYLAEAMMHDSPLSRCVWKKLSGMSWRRFRSVVFDVLRVLDYDCHIGADEFNAAYHRMYVVAGIPAPPAVHLPLLSSTWQLPTLETSEDKQDEDSYDSDDSDDSDPGTVPFL